MGSEDQAKKKPTSYMCLLLLKRERERERDRTQEVVTSAAKLSHLCGTKKKSVWAEAPCTMPENHLRPRALVFLFFNLVTLGCATVQHMCMLRLYAKLIGKKLTELVRTPPFCRGFYRTVVDICMAPAIHNPL